MHKKFEINPTKIKGGCQLERKVVTHNSKSDLPLVAGTDMIAARDTCHGAGLPSLSTAPRRIGASFSVAVFRNFFMHFSKFVQFNRCQILLPLTGKQKAARRSEAWRGEALLLLLRNARKLQR